MRKKQKSFAKKNIKKKVKAKKPQAPKPRPPGIKPPVLKPRPPGPKPPAPRPTTRKPGPKPPTTTKKTTKKPLTGRPIRPTPKPLGPPKPPVILPGKPSTLKPTTTVKPDEFADLKSQLIKDINDLRSKHRAPALNFDQALANRAQKFADEAKDKSKHNIDEGNDASIIYLAKSKEDYKPLSYWTSGSENLEYEELDQLLTLKEFTQLIWIKTTKIGCGISKFDNRGSLITICLLSPKGNIQGQYRENVLRPNQ
uniref:SCP domain-containing protein n=1 Tax=Strongyloides venezuelensis TaxID=75913 RepID=A0A0K0FJ61_STRVS